MLSKVKNLKIPPRCTSYLYQILVQPILLYGSDIWGISLTAQKSVDKVFHWFMKLMLHIKQNTSNVMLVGEVGMFPPSVLCHRNTLMYFIRLNNMPQASVLKSVFLESKRLCELGHRSWYTKVWELAQSYNLDIYSYDDSNASKQLIKSTVTEKYTFEWLAKLQDLFRWENYLSCVQNPQYHNALTKFRTSSHTLEIERGRHTNPITPVEQRLCNVCHELEDELHFLLGCNMFTDERIAFLYQIQNEYSQFITLDNKEKFIFLLQNEDSQVITWTAKFIHHAMKKRNNWIHQ